MSDAPQDPLDSSRDVPPTGPGYFPAPGYFTPAGYPPPSPGHYFPSPPAPPGFPPPAYPPAGFPPPYSGGHFYPPIGPLTAGEAWRWAWAQFTKRAGLLIGAPLAWFGIGILPFVFLMPLVFVIPVLKKFVSPYQSGTHADSVTTPLIVAAVMGIALLALSMTILATACQLAACLDIADGKTVTFASFFRPRRLWPYVGATLLVWLGFLLGLVLLVVPGLVFYFLAQFTVYFVVDRKLGIIDAIKASVKLWKGNVSALLLVCLIGAGLSLASSIVGQLTCGIGSLITIPCQVSIMGLLTTYCYRRLSGGVAAPPPLY